MKLFITDKSSSDLSDDKAKILNAVREMLFSQNDVEEVFNPQSADAIILQEKNSFKNFRYIKELEFDALISAYPEKVFTINTDDCATGLLRGLYTSLPKTRFNPGIYTSVPYMDFPNELVFINGYNEITPAFLATWRGNTKSNSLRPKMVSLLEKKSEFCIQKTDSWLNHNPDEKIDYVNLIRAAKFSLCPGGWASVSYRIYESMALGRCPVIIADNFVPPKGPNWKDFALFYPEKDMACLSSFLHRNEYLAEELGKNAFKAWQKYFCADVIKEYYSNSLLSLIRSGLKISKEAEVSRWKSFGLQWSNRWTMPQRAINILSKLSKKAALVS